MGIFTLKTDEDRTKLKPFALAMMLLAVLLSAAYPGTDLSLPLAMAVLILTIGVVIVFTRSSFCILLVVIPISFIWLYTGGSFEYAALLCSPITVIGVGAFLVKTTRSPYLLGIVPAAYLMALLIGNRPIAALLSLIFFPAAYILAIGFSGKAGRMAMICRISVSLAAISAVVLIVWLSIKNGRFDLALVPQAVDNLFEALVDLCTNWFADMANVYLENGVDITTAGITAADARLYAVALFGIIPALAIVALNAVSFVAYQLTLSLFGLSGQKSYLTPETVSFSMSWISAVVFILAYFVMLISNLSSAENIGLVAENLYLILLPGLVLTGVMIALGKGSDGRRHTFRIFFMIGLVFLSPNLALAFAAFMGCGDIFKNALSHRASKDI